MRDRRFGTLRQQHPDPVATPDAESGEGVGAAVRQTLQIVKAEPRDRAVGRLVDQRQPAAAGGVAVYAGNADVKPRWDLPAEAAHHLVVTVGTLQHVVLRRLQPK